MIIYDEIIENGSGLYIVFQKDENENTIALLTRLIIPNDPLSLFTEWKEIFDGTIITYGLNFKTGSCAYNFLTPEADINGEISTGEMPSMMEAINWDKVMTVHYLDHKHSHLYAMIIEAGSTISIPVEPTEDPVDPVEDPVIDPVDPPTN